MCLIGFLAVSVTEASLRQRKWVSSEFYFPISPGVRELLFNVGGIREHKDWYKKRSIFKVTAMVANYPPLGYNPERSTGEMTFRAVMKRTKYQCNCNIIFLAAGHRLLIVVLLYIVYL